MQHGIHFISGLPRSGSTLLAAVLRQNPGFHAAMSSPLCSMYVALQAAMSGRNDFHVFISDEQRRAILRGIFDHYYEQIHPTKMVFDTNRAWCSKLSSLIQLFPTARVICCVRNPMWILDSFERLVQRNAFTPSKLFGFETGGTVYSRAEQLNSINGALRVAYDSLREAFYGEHADRLLLVTYENLARSPGATLEAIYDFIDEQQYAHDFEHVQYDADEFDAQVSMPGLHRVSRRIEFVERQTILPSDLAPRFQSGAFWTNSKLNPRNVRIV